MQLFRFGESADFTDSQCVAGLLGRRAGLEANDFLSRRSGRPLKSHPSIAHFSQHMMSSGFELI